MTHCRTVNAMMNLFQCAKLDASLSASVRPVQFADHLPSDEYKLFEVDSILADELLNQSTEETMELKDEPGKSSTGRVYACTNKQTYSVIETEISNTLLLVPNGSALTNTATDDGEPTPAIVKALKTSYLELTPCIAPSLRLLKQKMSPYTYHGPIEDESGEEQENLRVQTRTNLSMEFPCSASELIYAFSRLRMFEIDGYMRLVDPDYLIQIIRDIFSCADEHAWDWRHTGFSVKRLIGNLETQYSMSILKQIVGIYFFPRTTATSKSSADLIVFPRNSKICQLVGENLLSVTNSFDLNDFKAVWRATVPFGLRPKLRRHLTCAGRAFCRTTSSSFIAGVSTTDRSVGRGSSFRTISLLRSEDLPDESVELRLNALFERCSVWPEHELASYLTDLLVPPDTTCGLHSDSVVGPLSFPCDGITDSDFEYNEEVDSTDSGFEPDSDKPKPVPPSVGTTLSHLCRVMTNSDQGRMYTKKYAIT